MVLYKIKSRRWDVGRFPSDKYDNGPCQLHTVVKLVAPSKQAKPKLRVDLQGRVKTNFSWKHWFLSKGYEPARNNSEPVGFDQSIRTTRHALHHVIIDLRNNADSV